MTSTREWLMFLAVIILLSALRKIFNALDLFNLFEFYSYLQGIVAGAFLWKITTWTNET